MPSSSGTLEVGLGEMLPAIPILLPFSRFSVVTGRQVRFTVPEVCNGPCSMQQTSCYNRGPFQQQFRWSFKFSRARSPGRAVPAPDRHKDLDQEEQ